MVCSRLTTSQGGGQLLCLGDLQGARLCAHCVQQHLGRAGARSQSWAHLGHSGEEGGRDFGDGALLLGEGRGKGNWRISTPCTSGGPFPRHWQPNPHEGVGKGDVQLRAIHLQEQPQHHRKGALKVGCLSLLPWFFYQGEETQTTPAIPSHSATCPLPSISVQPTAKCGPQSPSPPLPQQPGEGNSQPRGLLGAYRGDWGCGHESCTHRARSIQCQVLLG